MMGQFSLLIVIVFIFLSSSFRSCNSQADNNTSKGLSCSSFDKSDPPLPDTYKTHLGTLLDSLSTSVNTHKGFFKTSVAGDVYGLIQCRADVSPSNCVNCTLNSISIANNECRNSRTASIFSRWCFLNYQDTDFTGKELDAGYSFGGPSKELDGTWAIAKGETFMTELARNTSNQPLMYKTGVLDLGVTGKRYGMTECNRDIKRTDCEKCLEGLSTGLVTVTKNRGWEMYTLGCRMWYDDFKFYSDIAVDNSPAVGSSNVLICPGLSFFLLIVIHLTYFILVHVMFPL